MIEGFQDYAKFVELSVEEKKYQIGVYTATSVERPYYRPLDPKNLLAGMMHKATTTKHARMARMMYDTVRARQRANALYERRRNDYYMLAHRNAESDIHRLETEFTLFESVLNKDYEGR
jgi:hypothetical protein